MDSLVVLLLYPVNAYLEQEFDRRFCLLRLWEHSPPDSLFHAHWSAIRAVVGYPGHKVDAALLDALPSLEIFSSFSVGIDHVDLAECRERGIRVTHTPGVLTDDVADIAVGLAIAALRKIPQAAGRPVRARRLVEGQGRLHAHHAVDMDVSDSSSSSMEYDNGNIDEEELDFTSAYDNAPPEDGHTYGDDYVDESMDVDGIDREDDNVDHDEEDVDTDNIQSDVVDEPNDDETLDSGFVDEVLVGDNSSYDYYGDSDLKTIEDPVRRSHVKSVGKKKNESQLEDDNDKNAEDKRDFYWEACCAYVRR
ncbi:hypothetical protein ACQ4PT_067780 [Festuca glaucescens]